MDHIIDDRSDCSSCSCHSTTDHDIEDLNENPLLAKYIIHLDVDCFYCQTEELRNPALASKPLAIGQKHIIVTSNYVARKMGVKKLQGRRDALRSCPSLIIVEGSDLEPYRDASRSIYSVFRAAVKELHPTTSAKKGGMDEYFADITAAVDNEWENNRSISLPDGVWIYGDNSSVARITEDQSGASSISVWKHNENGGERWGTKEEKKNCAHKMQIAAKIARQIQNKVKEKTGFSTTIGISSSPMLSKLAADLKKPKSCNILYPWRSASMIANMPLRRIPDLGSKTLWSMSAVLKQYNGDKEDNGAEFWTCRDLLRVPRHAIQSCLEKDTSGSFYDLLLNRCRGIDTLSIVDDGGCLTKTVSVEDSFIRGSLTCMREVIKNLEILFVRILRLLDKRKEVSHSPDHAHPRTIRLTARIVDRSVTTSRRSFRSISRQATFTGKVLMEMKDTDERIALLKRCTMPLLQILSGLTIGLNVTRLNLATTSFADMELKGKEELVHQGKTPSASRKQSDLTSFFQHTNRGPVNPSNDEHSRKQSDLASFFQHANRGPVKSTNDGHVSHITTSTSFKRNQAAVSKNDVSFSKRTSMQDVIESLKRKRYRKMKSTRNSRNSIVGSENHASTGTDHTNSDDE
jgi:DNA polymerase iota